MNAEIELKSCPFCGGSDIRNGEDDFGWYQVYCSTCGGCIEDSTRHKSIAAWNTRPAPTEAEVEAAAKRICFMDVGSLPGNAGDWSRLTTGERTFYLRMARAALGVNNGT